MCSCICDVYYDHVLTQRFLIYLIFRLCGVYFATMVELARESNRWDIQVRDHHTEKRPGNAKC